MNVPPLLRVLRETLSVLESAGIRFAILGGFAVRVWGIPRPTYDLDIAVAAGKSNLRRLLEAFEDAGFDVPEGHRKGFLDTVAGMSKCTVHRFGSGHVWDVDIFIASTPFLRSALRRSVAVDMEGRRVPVLRAEDVVLLKLVAGRRKDLVDVEEILVLGGGLNRRRLDRWAPRLGVSRRLARALREAGLK